MKTSALQKYTALALAILGLSIFALLADGKALEFLDRRIFPLVFISSLVLVALAQVLLSKGKLKVGSDESAADLEPENQSGNQITELLWLAVPVIVSILFAY